MENCTIWIFFSVLNLVTYCVSSLEEGDNCILLNDGIKVGKCTTIHNCTYAQKLLRVEKIQPETCGFNRATILVCCPLSDNNSRTDQLSKSDKKCQEYYDIRLIEVGVAYGTKAKSKEFPHMAALGYSTSDKKSDLVWLCGGSLISNRYILTAAHCTRTTEYGDPKWVRLGDLNLNDTTDISNPKDLKVEEVFVHRGFKPPSHYNDIALLKLEDTVSFNDFIKPACIFSQNELPQGQVEVIGWGKTDFFGDASNHLLKAFLNVIEYKKCAQIYSAFSGRKLNRGIDDRSQICAGDSSGKDTCPGDSGGPLHFFQTGNSDLQNHYVVVGITSFGQGCGFENSAGVYTRVSAYRDWIEKIVWP